MVLFFYHFNEQNKTVHSQSENKHLQLSLQRFSDYEYNAIVIGKLMTIENYSDVLSYKIKIITFLPKDKMKHLLNEVLIL